MKKTVLTFGLISGAISSLLMLGTTSVADRIGFGKAEYLGYTVIILSLLMVFFGVRSYRDNVGNGHVTFGKAFAVGISITMISCICYVITWEFIFIHFFPDFMDKYGAYLIEKMRTAGQSQAAMNAQIEQLKKLKAMYANPFINAAMTFIEPFPIGLGMTLISAAVLRRKPQRVDSAVTAS